MFVRAVQGRFASLGVGKQIDRRESVVSVQYFDVPTANLIVHEIDPLHLEQVTIPEQTRIYHFDDASGVWEGRVRQGGVISAVAVGHRQAALAVMCRG